MLYPGENNPRDYSNDRDAQLCVEIRTQAVELERKLKRAFERAIDEAIPIRLRLINGDELNRARMTAVRLACFIDENFTNELVDNVLVIHFTFQDYDLPFVVVLRQRKLDDLIARFNSSEPISCSFGEQFRLINI